MLALRNTTLCLCMALATTACGGARTRTAAAASSVRTDTAAEAAVPAPEGPCSVWDPASPAATAPLDVAAPPPRSRNGGDGLRFCILRDGTGAVRPTRESRVRVQYTGWTTDGEMFDSSRERGEPASFQVTGVIRGWTDSLTHMTVGEVRRVWIPEELAYRGEPGMPAGMLVFDIELVAIE